MSLRPISKKFEPFQSTLPRTAERTSYRLRRPLERRNASSQLCKRATDSSEQLELVKREDKGEDTILFVFGTEAEKQRAISEKEKERQAQEPKNVASGLSDKPVSNSTPVEESVESGPSSEATQAVKSADEEQEKEGHLSNSGAESLEDLRVVDLRELCKKRGFQGYTKMKKDELIALLKEEL